MSNEKVMSMQCTHGYTVYEKRMYVCLYWLWSTDYVQMCEILWNKYSFIHMYIDTTPGSVPSRASSSSCLLSEGQTLPYLTGLNWFAILHRFVQFTSLLRQMQLGNSHDLLHMLNSSCNAVSSAVAPHIHWITSCSSTSMHRPLSLGLGTTGTVDRKGPRWQPCN